MYKAIQHCPLCIAKNYFKHYDAVVHTKPKATFARSQKLVFFAFVSPDYCTCFSVSVKTIAVPIVVHY